VNVNLGWQNGLIRVREDWTTLTRFTLADTSSLGAGVTTVAAAGRIDISQLWLEIEYVYGPTFYDPFDGVTPDAIVGPLNWITAGGGVPGAITGNNYLRVDDVDPLNSFAYIGPILLPYTPDEFRNDYVTEAETRLIITNPTAAPDGYTWLLFDMFDTTGISLAAVKLGGVLHLGLIEDSVNPLDPNNYAALVPFDYVNKDLHVRLRIDRNQVPGDYGQVEVFIDYAETPLLQAGFWQDFPHYLPFFSYLAFGTSPGLPYDIGRADIDYLSWRHFKRDGGIFKNWDNWDFSSNQIGVDFTDSEIVRKVFIDPPGVTAGQSHHACVLDVTDPPEPCAISQVEGLPDPNPTLYDLSIDYKMDIAFTEGELILQRSSDLWYWDEIGTTWSSTFQSVTLPNQITRTTLAAMSSISLTSVTDDVLIVTIGRKTAGFPAYKILIYKVHLEEQ